MKFIQGKEYDVKNARGEWEKHIFVIEHDGMFYFECGFNNAYLLKYDEVREVEVQAELIYGAKYYVKNYEGEEWGKKPREFVFNHKGINYFESNVPNVLDYWNFFKKVHSKFEIGEAVTHLGSLCIVTDIPLDGLVIAKNNSGIEIVATENIFKKI